MMHKAWGMGRWTRLLACGLAAVLLGGCASPLSERPPAEGLPNDIDIGMAAPQVDAVAERQTQAVLYYPSLDGVRLRAEVAPVTVRAGESEAEAVMRALLTNAPPPGARAVAAGVLLDAVEHPVIVAGEVATVMLTAEARLLSPRDLCAARMAIANTLTELPGIAYVSVLVQGMEEGADLAGIVPFGAQARQSTGDIDSVWRQIEAQQEQLGLQSFSKLAAVYVPAPGGRFMLPQVRNLAFADAQPTTLVMNLLGEISKGAIGLEGAPAVPDLVQYLANAPEVLQQADSSARAIRLNFRQELEEALAKAGMSKGMLCALLTQNFTTFIPGICGVQVRLGIDAVTELPAADTLSGRPVSLSGDLWTSALFWEDVASLIYIALPTSKGDQLVRVRRPVQATRCEEPRYVLEQLMLGPQSSDGRQDLMPAMPEGVGVEDVRAIAIEGDSVLISLSRQFATACAGLDQAGERRVIYAIVNTMTEFSQARRVAFFVEGEQIERLTGGLEMRGFFLRNPGMFQ